MDINIPYLSEIFTGIAVFLTFLLLIKSSSRWQSLFLGIKSKGYNLSSFGYKKILVYEGIMLLYFGLFGYIMLNYIDIGFWLGIAGGLFFIEGVAHLLFYFIAKPYKILINDRSITILANAMSIVKWSEVQKIDSRQNDIHIIRKDGSIQVIDVDWLLEDDKSAFIDEITKKAQQKNIYCSIDCKGSYKDFAKMAMQKKFEV